MQSQGLDGGRVTCLSITSTLKFRAYLDQLVDKLDHTSLQAALKLMICEKRGVIQEQRRQIALERLDGRDIVGRTEELREQETLHDELVALCTRNCESEGEPTLLEANKGRSSATRSSASTVSEMACLCRKRLPLQAHV